MNSLRSFLFRWKKGELKEIIDDFRWLLRYTSRFKGRIALKTQLAVTNRMEEDAFASVMDADWLSFSRRILYRTTAFKKRCLVDEGLPSTNKTALISNIKFWRVTLRFESCNNVKTGAWHPWNEAGFSKC